MIGIQLANTWNGIVLQVAGAQGHVSKIIQRSTIQRYLNFLLRIRHAIDTWAPGELGLGFVGKVNLEAWWDLFMEPWETCPLRDSQEQACFVDAFDNLDSGKPWVTYSRDLLQKMILR